MTDDGLHHPLPTKLPELRLRTARHPDDLEAMRSKLPSDSDYHLRLSGPCRVLKPTGQPLCTYLPGVLLPTLEQKPEIYEVLHTLKDERTDNRGDASGTKRIVRGEQKRTRSSLVASALVGAADPGGIYRYCRLTAWTGTHMAEYAQLFPLFTDIDRAFRRWEHDRYNVQAGFVARTPSEWVVPGTVFTTVTVNNSYSTGCHTDKGDLEEGFSTLAVLRRGDYLGGETVFPRWGVAVDMQDGDLLLLDAHEMHGNTTLRWPDGEPAEGDRLPDGTFERISLVCYFRAKLVDCGTAEEEQRKAYAYAAERSGFADGD